MYQVGSPITVFGDRLRQPDRLQSDLGKRLVFRMVQPG
jgi:hypothetical protein